MSENAERTAPAGSAGPPVGSRVQRPRRQRRPTGAPPPLPHPIVITTTAWLLLAVIILAGAFLISQRTPWLRLGDRASTWFLRLLAEARTPWLTDLATAIKAAGSGWGVTVIGLSVVVLTMVFRRWRHLLVFVGSLFFLELVGRSIYFGLSRPRPYGITIIGSWGGYSGASPPVAALTIFLISAVYCLVVPGRPRGYAKIAVAVVIAPFCLARVYLAVDHPDDVLLGVAFAVAISVTAFRFFTPNEVFPVVYRRGKTAHVDVSGRRGEAIRTAVRDQLGLTVLEIKPVGLESSASSTPLRLRVEGGPDEYLFAKLYTKGHVRADRWYKLWRIILYGSLEDEHPFQTVHRLTEHEDYALLLLQKAGIRTAKPYGIVEITPQREYLLVTEFFTGAAEIGDADIDDDVIDQGLSLVRKLWDAGIAHRDIKPGNLMVRSGELLLIDVGLVQGRPSPWRQAVDLGNMMLVLAVRTDPERVYRRALRYFTPDELSEAFAATRGMASPAQLRAFMKRDPRDLLATFRALATPRAPIVLQRWSIRRVGLAAAMLGAIVIPVAGGLSAFFPAENIGASPPAVRHRPFDDPGGSGGPIGGAGALHSRTPAGLAGWRRRHHQRARQLLAGLRSSRRACRDRYLVRDLRRFRRPADQVRPADDAALRAPVEPAPALHVPALLHLPRRLRHLPVPFRARYVPPPRDPIRQRGGLHAPRQARGLRQEHRGPGVVRAGCGMPGMSRPGAAGRPEHLLAAPRAGLHLIEAHRAAAVSAPAPSGSTPNLPTVAFCYCNAAHGRKVASR